MSFEKTAVAVAAAVGIENAYFYEGTMFFYADNADVDSLDDFRLVYPNIIVSNIADEVAIDFTE